MPLTNRDADFWWLRYFCGAAVPVALLWASVYSLVFRHSYTIWFNIGISGAQKGISFVPVQGEQAVLMSIAYFGLAAALFAHCYGQYHEKIAYYYQWILAPGLILTAIGFFWCSWISLHLF